MSARSARVTVGPHQIVKVNGKPVFPIGFIKGPPAGSRTPTGGDAYREIKSNGTVFLQVGPKPRAPWDAEAQASLARTMELAGKAGLLAAISIPALQKVGPADRTKTAELRRLVRQYQHSPALAFWKVQDEPAWSKVSATAVERYSSIVRGIDPHHPIWLIFAPRGTVPALRAYNAAYDIGALDIYPISYPPGKHSLKANKDISMVGDYALELQRITEGRKPFFMVLQICWSGVSKPGKTLRFPTFPQERYMAYQSIIDGARGLVFFGGNYVRGLDARDLKLGWNWRFYNRILKPLLNELNPNAPVYPALIAPDSKLPITLAGSHTVEYLAREAGGYLYILAAKRQGATTKVEFKGLPSGITTGKVLYEPPRTVTVANGTFTDWFAPHDVHVYRFKMP